MHLHPLSSFWGSHRGSLNFSMKKPPEGGSFGSGFLRFSPLSRRLVRLRRGVQHALGDLVAPPGDLFFAHF